MSGFGQKFFFMSGFGQRWYKTCPDLGNETKIMSGFGQQTQFIGQFASKFCPDLGNETKIMSGFGQRKPNFVRIRATTFLFCHDLGNRFSDIFYRFLNYLAIPDPQTQAHVFFMFLLLFCFWLWKSGLRRNLLMIFPKRDFWASVNVGACKTKSNSQNRAKSYSSHVWNGVTGSVRVWFSSVRFGSGSQI